MHVELPKPDVLRQCATRVTLYQISNAHMHVDVDMWTPRRGQPRRFVWSIRVARAEIGAENRAENCAENSC